MCCRDFSDFKKYVLQGSVPTQLKYRGIFNNYVIANCPHCTLCQWKKFENRLIFGEDMKSYKVGRFWDTVYKCKKKTNNNRQQACW